MTEGLAIDADLLEQVLLQCARNGTDISYSEALLAMGIRFTRPKMRLLCKVLGEIEERAKQNGEPELAVLVVRGSDRLPGDGWWAGRRNYRGEWTGERATKYVKRLQRKAFQYWRPNV